MNSKKSLISRRAFFGTSLTGLVAAGISGCSPQPEAKQEKAEIEKGGEIIFRTLGRTGYKLPIISMGEGTGLSPALIQAGYDKGIIYFDTAADYQHGRNEKMLGDVISRLGIRDKLVLATKIFSDRQRRGKDAQTLKKGAVALIDESLRRLGTDYVDIVYLHSVTSANELHQPGLLEAMQNLVKLGKAKAIGLATHTGMASILNDVAGTGDWDVVETAFNFTMKDDTELIEAIENVASKGLGIIAMKTQAGGANWPDPVSLRKYSNSTINKAALKWAVNNKNITTAVPGIANYDQLNENWQVAINPQFTENEKEFLANNKVTWTIGFCRQCGQCLVSCPNGSDIPTLMRIHMYSAQYGDFYLARTTLDSIANQKSLAACNSCSRCTARCAREAVDISRKIADLKLMYA